MIKVLFVCLGNICRSPMAEAVFANLVREAGLQDQIEIDSAGTAGYHAGECAHHGTLAILQKHGIHYTGRSRRLTRNDLQEFDYIIAMDDENYNDIRTMMQRKVTGMLSPITTQCRIARLLDFAPQVSEREVPDPYYNGAFEHVYDLVTAGGLGLLSQIRKERLL